MTQIFVSKRSLNGRRAVTVNGQSIPVFIAKPYMDPDYYTVTDALNAIYNQVPTYRMGLIPEAQAIAQGEKAADNLHFLTAWHYREGVGLGDWFHDVLFPRLGLYA